ncbi:TPA: sulfite exporter TauE/SafE family protein [Candidatus Peregrinibacteria bacterium]|nr:sulfite exporter TauE/SafE family protein [Candidatus Peregrinibacteria bacterium]HIQ57735.1 sulfite exporter TauE/SafE family protein [Candidatus Gracilibacteria bacterium]
MPIEIYVIIAVVVFFTAIMSSIAGFGSGIIIIMLFSFFYDIKIAIGLASVIFLFTNINKILLFYKTVDWDFVKIMYITMLPACGLGVYFFDVVSTEFIKYFLASFGIFMIIDHIFPFRKSKTIEKFTKPKILMGGFFMGLFSGLASGGFTKTFLLQARGLSKEMMVGTGVILTIGINIIKLPAYMYYDYLHVNEIFLLAPLYFVNLAGSFLGKKLLKNISKKLFENIILVIIFCTVVKYLFY